jgi:hypothetical protein
MLAVAGFTADSNRCMAFLPFREPILALMHFVLSA